MAAHWAPDATPSRNEDRLPTDGEKQYFRSHPRLSTYFTVVAERSTAYNCVGWSLGFKSRWIDGGTPDTMERLYSMYFFERVTSANLAEIDIYMKRDAPEYRRIQRHGATVEIPNKDYNIIMHAHRNDLLNATLRSTSKMQSQVLIRHDRTALTDSGPWNEVTYDQICGHYRKSSEHPLQPGKSKNWNLIPGAPPGPNDRFWKVPRKYPVGHPMNEPTSGQYGNQGGYTAHPLRYYAPYKTIPPPSKAAVSYIQRVQVNMSKEKATAVLITKFKTYYEAWKKTWFVGEAAKSPNSIARTQVREFHDLMSLGSSIKPLVVAKLCNPSDFMTVQLYNHLEKNPKYKVSPDDAPNYLVLQRHANLIVEINKDRPFK